MFKLKTVLAAALVIAVLTGLLIVSSALAQQGPPSNDGRTQCQSLMSQDTVNPILARHRDRLQTVRESMIKEERALTALLVADNTTRAALDAQSAKTIEARNAFARARVDLLWDLRSVIPTQNREQAFRCAGMLTRRR